MCVAVDARSYDHLDIKSAHNAWITIELRATRCCAVIYFYSLLWFDWLSILRDEFDNEPTNQQG